MELTPEELDAVLGAYAIDALDPAERDDVEQALAADPELARRAARLQEVTAALAGAPGPGLLPSSRRDELLGRAVEARAPGRHLANPTGPHLAPAELWRRQFAELDVLLDDLGADDWQASTAFDRPVHALLAHLSAVLDQYAADIGAGQFQIPDGTPLGHWELTEPRIAELAGQPTAETVALLRTAATRIHGRLLALPPQALDVVADGQPLSVGDRTRLQVFELWLHTDEVRRATGRAMVDPDPERICAMSDLSARFVGLGMLVVGRERTGRRARLVLTGPGGGTWRPPLSLDVPDPALDDLTTVVVDAVDYCRMAGQLITVDDLDLAVEGDEAAALDLLAGARAFTV